MTTSPVFPPVARSFRLEGRLWVELRGFWDVEGDFMGWDYRVTQGSLEIMSISKQLFNWGDTYALHYQNPANEFPGLLLVIAIDAANCDHDD